MEPKIQLYDPNGLLEIQSEDYSRARIENHQLLKTGVYTIVVSDWTTDVDTGEYGLSFALIPDGTTSTQDPDGGDIASGESKSGSISPVGDTDICAFYGQAGQGVVIEMGEVTVSMEPKIQLYDPNGLLEIQSEDYSRARIENHQLLKTGIYTIIASDGYTDADVGEYGLSLALIPPSDPYGLYPYDPCPSNGGLVSACASTELRWYAVTGATGYDVYFGKNVIEPLNKITDDVSTAWVDWPATENGKIYYWHVVAHAAGGDIPGPTWWFETARADFTCDGLLNFLDFAELAGYWFEDEPSFDIAPLGGDGIIDYLDLSVIADEWLAVEACY
jgi:hypothetical protein